MEGALGHLFVAGIPRFPVFGSLGEKTGKFSLLRTKQVFQIHVASCTRAYLLVLTVTVAPSRNVKKNVVSYDVKYVHRLCINSELLMAIKPQETSTVKMMFTS